MVPGRLRGKPSLGQVGGPNHAQDMDASALLENQGREGPRGDFCDTALSWYSSCHSPGWMMSPQNSYAEPQPSVPQNSTLFGNNIVADVMI